MLVTMQNADLIGKLLAIAGGDLDLVQQAIRYCAGPSGEADLQRVVEYIVSRRPDPSLAAAAAQRRTAHAG